MQPPARHTLHDLVAFIFREETQQVEHQLALGGLLVLLAADSELLTAFKQLADDDALVRRVACDAVSGVKIDSIEKVGLRVAPQLFERRALHYSARDTVVDVFIDQVVAGSSDLPSQLDNLAFD